MTDWASEGLLDGLVSEEERAARRELLDRLSAEGCTLDELRRAVAEDRLSLLPVEKLLLQGRRYTPAEASELTGLSMDYIRRDFVAIGLTFDPDERHFTDQNIEAMRGLRAMIDAGVSERDVLMLTRMVGDASAKLAEAVMRTLGSVLLRPGDTERDFGLRIVEAANALMPSLGHMLQGPLEAHLVEVVRHEAIGRVEREVGSVPGGRPVAVCFADMVGFTGMAERMDFDELTDVTERFADVTAELARPPVRLVKTIGDEAMLASEDAPALIEAALALIDAAGQDDLLPPLRAGAAAGEALRRAGDLYGRPVNLAARITAIAPRDSLLANDALRAAASDDFAWSAAGTRGFKGIDGEVELYRVERSA